MVPRSAVAADENIISPRFVLATKAADTPLPVDKARFVVHGTWTETSNTLFIIIQRQLQTRCLSF